MSDQAKDYWRAKKFTLKGRIFYPKLVEPEEGQNGNKKYKVLFAWPAGDASQQAVIEQIKAFLREGKQKFFANVPDQFFNVPVKHYDTYQRQDGQPNAEFLKDCFWINASSGEKFKPKVLDRNKQEVLDPAEIYSGRNAAVSIGFYGWSYQGKSGIGCNLNAVVLLEGGEQEGGGNDINVDEAFGSFLQDQSTGGDFGGGSDVGGGNAGGVGFM